MLPDLALTVALAMVAIILHELAHGFAALALGDDTARRAGRLSLNPLRHVDPFGTVVLPGLLLASQLLTVGRVMFMFGWARPVPVDASRFRDPRRMMALVAIAGPAMNLLLAFAAALLLRDPGLSQGVAGALLSFVVVNLALALFNLLPVPPLDGGRIAVGVLPLRLARAWAGLERYGILIVLALIAGPSLLRQGGVEFDPLGHALNTVVPWAVGWVLRAAGVPGAGDVQV
jgi:Zn-dependent protease